MIVVINQREFEYVPDYPDGWKFSAGDPYKFPVLIGDHQCFIKRFEQRSPEDISGWELLVKMKGQYDKNLSRIYDIKNVKEGDKDIYYVIYEYLEGVTLDKYVKEPSINLSHLNTDLFNGIKSLQNYGFWFADFFEKNIFCQKGGTFAFVDVDSAQRMSDLPDNAMYGSKDYWILVLKYYKEILNKTDIRLDDIHGISLNYLQIPFLVLRLKMFMNSNREEYNSPEAFNQLPSSLNEMAPGIRELFTTAITNGKRPLAAGEISKIADLIENEIIQKTYTPKVAEAPRTLPVIKDFRSSRNEIESGESFILTWEVENADKLELNKNNARFQPLEIGQTSEELKEFADGTRQESSYQLVAYQDLDMVKSPSITIRLKDPDQHVGVVPTGVTTETRDKTRQGTGNGGGGKKIMKVALAIVVIAAIFFIARNLLTGKKAPDDHSMKISGFQPNRLKEGKDSTITFFGTNFPGKDDLGSIKVNLNGIPATVSPGPNNTFTVVAKIALLKQLINTDPLKIPVEVTNMGNPVFSDTLTCELDNEVLVTGFEPTNFLKMEDLIFNGKNLNLPGVEVRINGFPCGVRLALDNALVVRNSQPLPENQSAIPVEVFLKDKKVFLGVGNTLRIRFDPRLTKETSVRINKIMEAKGAQ